MHLRDDQFSILRLRTLPADPTATTSLIGSAARDQIRSPISTVLARVGIGVDKLELRLFKFLLALMLLDLKFWFAELSNWIRDQILTVRSREPVTTVEPRFVISTAVTSLPWQYRLANENSPVRAFHPNKD